MAKVIAIDCPRCEARVNADVMRTEIATDSETRIPEYRVSLSRCPGCGEPLLTREECVGQGDDWAGNAYAYGPPLRVWPEPDREAHKAIPPVVQISLDEAYKCRRAGAYTACAVMCGRALEGICVHFGIKTMLAKGLNELRTKGLIDERLFQWGEQLRKHRNAAAHATGERLSREDATDLLEFVAAICDYIFVLTARFDAFMARRTDGRTVSAAPASEGAPSAIAVPQATREDA